MEPFRPFAQPWWVNLLSLIPLLIYRLWRRNGPVLSRQKLACAGMFGIAFGYVEAAVVVYLRAAMGLLPGVQGALSDVARQSVQAYQQAQSAAEMPQSLLTVELFREAATIVMLVAVSLLAGSKAKERWAIFLWAFAAWDITYYAALWATVRWPFSLTNEDVLFLIPVPWLSQVWFPILISALTMLVIWAVRSAKPRESGSS